MVRGIPLISSSHPTSQNYNSSAINWNFVVLVIGVFSFNLDPFILYLPKDCGSTSICIDAKLLTFAAILRTLTDVSFLCGKCLMRTKCRALNTSRRLVVGNKEPKQDVRNYQKSALIFDLVAILPLPQILIWNKIHTSDVSIDLSSRVAVSTLVLFQLPLRVIAMVPVSRNTLKTSAIAMKNAWSGALLNLMYFMIVSHTWGGIYYELYITKLLQCKKIVTSTEVDAATLNWDQFLEVCKQHEKFQIGMFSDAITTKIVMRSLAQKYVYCLSWGLKSLSSFGQIFSASSNAVETFFSFLTVIFGLLLFGDLLARMQSGLQSTEVREDRQRTRQRMVEEWIGYHHLPHGLKKQVKQAIQSEWSATRGINDDTILDSLPWHVRCDVRRHMYLDIIGNLPPFAEMDYHLVKEICGHLRTFSKKEGTYIAFDGEPVQHMIFIFSGQVEVCCGNSVILGPGEMCGRELLEWCSLPTKSTENLPSSTQTVKCITNVDAFSLVADDVKLLAIQFHRDGKFRHAFLRYAA